MLALIAMLLLVGGGAMARDPSATLTVTKIADTADGVCDADCSLREAVTAAAGGDVIVFSSLFDSPQTITLTAGQIQIVKKLTIHGPGVELVTVSGNNASRIFHISGGVEVALEGMALKNGRAGGPDFANYIGGAIYVADSTLTLTNMLIRDNTALYTPPPPSQSLGSGGGIYSAQSTLTVNNSTISHNATVTSPAAAGGGGIYSQFGRVNIVASTISNNINRGIRGDGTLSMPNFLSVSSSSFTNNTGAAIINGTGQTIILDSTIQNNGSGIGGGDGASSLTIYRSVISDNQGGIFSAGTAMITESAIHNNSQVGGGGGGGIRNVGRTMYVLRSSISNNRSSVSGGGIYSGGTLYLTNSTVSGNIADTGTGSCICPGGGIHNFSDIVNSGGPVLIINSTISNNRSVGRGGGLRQEATATSSTALRNSIVAGNLSSTNEIDVSGAVVSQGFNLIGSTTGSTGWTTTDLLNTNPLLAPLGTNGGMTLTHALLPGSPAINAGSNALAFDPATNLPLAADQRGFGRITGGTVDIGAYEANYSQVPVAISGRIVTALGRGVSDARITLTSSTGVVIYTQTNPFGYYRFLNLMPGSTFIVSVFSKRHQFNSPVIVTVDQNRSDLNFTAQ